MKHIHFDIESNGFYGAYWECKDGSDCAVIAMLGDDPEDYMARSAVKWLLRLGVNVLTMSPGKRTTVITTIRLSESKKRLHGSNRTATQKSALRGHQQRARSP